MASSRPGSIAGLIFHTVIAIYFVIIIYYDVQIVTQHTASFGGRWKYLTFLDILAQVSFFILAASGDILAFITGREVDAIVSTRDILFATVTFPFGVFVTTTFWGIYAIDRELIFPLALDAIFPPWINHGLHTWNGIFMILEGAIIHHKYPVNRAGLFFMLLPAVVYLAWITYIAHTQAFWVYPFLRMMETPARIAFFIVCAVILALFYFMGKWMTQAIWEGEASTTKSQESKKTAAKKKTKKVQ